MYFHGNKFLLLSVAPANFFLKIKVIAISTCCFELVFQVLVKLKMALFGEQLFKSLKQPVSINFRNFLLSAGTYFSTIDRHSSWRTIWGSKPWPAGCALRSSVLGGGSCRPLPYPWKSCWKCGGTTPSPSPSGNIGLVLNIQYTFPKVSHWKLVYNYRH